MHLDPRVWEEELQSLYMKCKGRMYTAIWFGIHIKFPFVLQSTAPSMLTRNLYFSVLSIFLFGFICCHALCLCWFVSAKPQKEEWLRFLDCGWRWWRRVLKGFTLGAQTWMGKPHMDSHPVGMEQVLEYVLQRPPCDSDMLAYGHTLRNTTSKEFTV